ncbi:hypothetical protein NSU_3041 [Novosphingobium pentaromativorans US6-1]|uniref:Uncharacterized protein n=1 Tax=Novosphingobium pentaromativorans US6-1 TaxID=1088721 RepID=G6EFC0_9SPHN|nr:hypothetical protein NSU_3041 [Novosphingobium pentaromativorans US6-1]
MIFYAHSCFAIGALPAAFVAYAEVHDPKGPLGYRRRKGRTAYIRRGW